MKVFVHHDAAGTIRSLVAVDAPEGVSLMLQPRPGQFVAEVEGVTVGPDVPDVAALRELGRTHKVDAPQQPRRLAKKN
jgi:hypothetical protein